ncbi:MAG: alpha/beta fold hydrolase [Proteobacteria bacterium]|nr:alpha/beta fold hydrolase [Pseudomonadota bacterium]
MSASPSPDELFETFWKQTTSLWDIQVKTWRSWMDIQAAASPEPMKQWLQAQQQVWDQWSDMLQGSIGQADPLGRATEPLGRVVEENLRSALKVLSQSTGRMAARLEAANPQALMSIWEGLAREYQRDLAALPQKLKPTRVEDLTRLARELATASPSPEARRYLERFVETMRVKGVQGAEHYVDPSQVAVAPTRRELVLEVGSLQLYRYRAAQDAEHQPGRPPVLLIYSIINRAWILDLVPGFSIIAYLLEQGIDVYLAEWKPAEPGCQDTLDDFVDPWLHSAVGHIQRTSRFERVGLFGYCIGGTLATIYAACHPEVVQSLITLTTPIASSNSGILELLVNPALFPLDEVIETNRGVVPGKVLRHSIMAIKPYLEVLKWKAYYENLDNDQVMYLFEPIDRWANDNPDLPGEVFRSFVHEIYEDDRLAHGQTTIHGKLVDLSQITCPLLNLVAEDDWIVPHAAAMRLSGLVGAEDVRTEVIPGPHVGIVMDPRTRYAWELMANFIKEHRESSCAS